MRANLTPPEQPVTSEQRLPYFAGLDGLRALAVIAVLLYHADLPIAGGFLGVETFFALSGFLITGLLLAEWRQHGRINLQAFWLRRARRLLPALFFLLAGTLLYAGLAFRGGLGELRGDTLAALAYVMNWRLIVAGQSYFDPMLRPSLLQHLWSLAIEEQFYLLWPLTFVAGMRFLRATGLLVMITIAALGSTALVAVLYRPGADPSRLYYGTDTRAAGLLLGAALAFIWTRFQCLRAPGRSTGLLLDGGGLLALSGLLSCFIWLSERHPLLYPGGFALISILTTLVIAALIHPSTQLVPRLLGSGPLRWIGLRSYGLYLWHWPVFMVTRPYSDVPLDGLPLLALRFAIVGVLVELSYRFVELPVRHGALGRAWARLQSWAEHRAPQPVRRTYGSLSAPGWLRLLLPIVLLVALGITAAGHNTLQLAAPVTSAKITRSPLPWQTAPANRPTASPRVELAEILPPITTVPAVDTPEITVDSAGDTPESLEMVEAPTMAPSEPIPTTIPVDPVPFDPAIVAELQHLLDDTVADGFVPGAVVSISIPGYIPWNGASGISDLDRDLAMAPDTLIHAASITKMFTAVTVLQLAEEGLIDLDQPIATWLPDIVPLATRTTVRHLLSHTSGIFDYLEDRRFFVEAYQNPERAYTPDELVGMVDQFGAAFEPGTEQDWKYSSTNYVILGMLVEQVTGRTLAQEMRQRIIGPLGLTHTFFAPNEPIEGTLAQGYIDDSDRANVSMTFVYGTANIISTAGELRTFADALFDGRLLSPASLATMEAVQDTGGAYDMPELAYGLGLMSARLNVGPAPDGARRAYEESAVLGHIGGVAGFRSAVWHVPESDITIALSLNQADIDPNLLARDILDAILTWQGR